MSGGCLGFLNHQQYHGGENFHFFQNKKITPILKRKVDPLLDEDGW